MGCPIMAWAFVRGGSRPAAPPRWKRDGSTPDSGQADRARPGFCEPDLPVGAWYRFAIARVDEVIE